jgi:hypothetical protein
MFRWVTLSPEMSLVKDVCGYLAGCLVLCTFSVKSMGRLRCLGIASNLAFITYAMLAKMPPILILHGIFLPINIYHLTRIELVRQSSRCLNLRHAVGSPHRSIRPFTVAFFRKSILHVGKDSGRETADGNGEQFMNRCQSNA